MKCSGIIAEYNPFHQGHEYHLQQSLSLSGSNHTVVIMSGNFVQRGDIAIFDKFYRAKQALLHGADMVIELPCAFAVSCAERFAATAVNILDKSGIIDSLSFGSESSNLEMLEKQADNSLFESTDYTSKIKESLKTGVSFAKAKSEALEFTPLPNDVLAIEYIKAIKRLNSSIKPVPIKRIGAMHDSPIAEKNSEFMSASAVRELILSGNMQPGSTPVSSNSQEFSSAMLYALRTMSKAEIAALPDVSEGLENAVYTACRQASSYAEFLSLVKSKRYTLARLRRIAICALLRISDKLQNEALAHPELYFYIRVLGVKKSSSFLLSELSKRSKLPVITGFSDTKSLSPQAKELLSLDLLSSDIYNLFLKKSADSDYTRHLIFV
ncbi:MAG: nucleotidyltransferase family protein [Clostridia bacterium]|nr:nucleotidyltransferase family protein [Clostridia bacterium]